MSTVDLSRNATDFTKQYSSVRLQQGRVQTDEDANEQARIIEEDARRTRVDTIGAYGSPDDGFMPKDFSVVSGKPTFKLSAGKLYLGGLYLELGKDEFFHLQKDWLNFDEAVHMPDPPADGTERIDLAYLEVWQQPVSATEDSELKEVALGGPDTSLRMRTIKRVRVIDNIDETECDDAWAAAIAGMSDYDAIKDDMEFATDARLRVTYTAPTEPADLCSPGAAGGYLYHENQAIRVQMVSPTHYTWAFDNACCLYRVQVTAANDGTLTRIQMLNEPRDAMHWPLQDTVVELLPWSAALTNGERIAELSGMLAKVTTSFNPDLGFFEIDTPVPGTFGTQWDSRSDKADFFDGSAEERFYYLRVWRRDETSSPAAIPIANGQLGNTGLEVSFEPGTLRTNDHWIIAARTGSPNEVVPWVLESADGAPPHGYKIYRAPLGLIRWTSAAGAVSGELLHDCREPFLPLTKIRNCCTVTVGDGTHSYGKYASIQDAVNALPEKSGGVVCVLPGEYRENISIFERKDITIRGCGYRSKIIATPDPTLDGPEQPALQISDSLNIQLESIAIESGPRSAIEVLNSHIVLIDECIVQMRDESSIHAAIFLDGEDLRVKNSVVTVLGEPYAKLSISDMEKAVDFEKYPELNYATSGFPAIGNAARGGIQLAGGCERIRIENNLILGGAGNGVTLGSLRLIPADGSAPVDVVDVDPGDEPCIDCGPADNTHDNNDPDNPDGDRYVSAGHLYDIEISNNEIYYQGANGISVLRFFAEEEKLEFIGVHKLNIKENRIENNLRRTVSVPNGVMRLFNGYGGIALALVSDLEVIDNHIVRNGRTWLDPVCGIFVLVCYGASIDRNRILHNGPIKESDVSQAQQGMRAGIHIWLAMGESIFANGDKLKERSIRSHTLSRKIHCHSNEIIQPMGRALFILGAGTMAITDNQLVSQNNSVRAIDPLATTVIIVNFGIAVEITMMFILTLLLILFGGQKYKLGEGNEIICLLMMLAYFYDKPLSKYRPSGKVMFSNNQVSFDGTRSPKGTSLSSALLFSLDDLGAVNNQFEVKTMERKVLVDVIALAGTVRLNDNRMAETWMKSLFSALSLGVMNTTTDNQATHCIKGYGLKEVIDQNLSLAESMCPQICNLSRYIGRFVAVSRANFLVGSNW
jgi:hypothetical protein